MWHQCFDFLYLKILGFIILEHIGFIILDHILQQLFQKTPPKVKIEYREREMVSFFEILVTVIVIKSSEINHSKLLSCDSQTSIQ